MRKVNNIPILLLILGMLAGLGTALGGLLIEASPAHMPDTMVARVNEHYISREDYARALAGMVSDSDQPLTRKQRRHVLRRLIDEELLIQYGLDQGLVRSDRRVRANLVSAVLEAKSVDAETREISEAEAREFYLQNKAYFSRPQQLQVVILRVPDRSRAEQWRQQWLDQAADPFPADVQRLEHVPDDLIPIGKLRQLAGSTLTEMAMRLPAGQVSQPLALNNEWYLLRVKQRRDTTPAFAQVIEQVGAEIRRRNAERAVQLELEQLREIQEVVIAEDRI